MAVKILSFIHNATTLIFGVYISAAFLGVKMSKRNIFVLMGFSSAVGVVYVLSYILFGESVTEQIYPFIVHLPLVVFLSVFYKYKFALSLLSVLTAYLCCQFSNWMGLAVLNTTNAVWAYYVVRIATTTAVFAVLIVYVSDATARLLKKPTKSILILGLMPFVYYVFDYVAGVYTTLLYSGPESVTEFLGFMLCVFYILFIFLYFREFEQKTEAEQQSRMLKIQYSQTKKEIEAIRRSQRSVAILRHDMRHFLLSISSFIENNEDEKALGYIRDLIDVADNTATKKYSKNEIVNMILSFYEDEIEKNDIAFKYNIELPKMLGISDVDLTAILSNGLENAVQAVLPLDIAEREIMMDMHTNENNKLLISIKNRFAKQPIFKNGLPQTDETGHGFGTQSIRYVAEKLNGNCRFSAEKGMFVLQVVI